MRLPKKKIIFVVDFLRSVGAGRGMIDFYPLETESAIKQVLAMDWERLIRGIRVQATGWARRRCAGQLTFLQDGLEAVKVAAREGNAGAGGERRSSCRNTRMARYENNLQFVTRRYCGLWGRGT